MNKSVTSQTRTLRRVSENGDIWYRHALVFAFAAVFLYFLHFRGGVFFWRLSQQEGGTWFDEAFFTLQGEVIYRDFFEQNTPGIVYVNAFFLWLLGVTTTAVGVAVVVIGVVCALAVFAVSAVVLSGYWRYVPPAIFVGMTYPSYTVGSYKWPTIILCLVGILAVIETRSRLRCAVCGIAHGGAMLCTQDFGVGATLGMAVALWLLRGQVPAAGIVVTEALITQSLETLTPGPSVSSVAAAKLGDGVIAFAAIRAPMGLSQAIVFEWRHEDHEERIVAEIHGGRENGFRTYARKRIFPLNSQGRWTVDILTPQRQLLQRLRFDVEASPGS